MKTNCWEVKQCGRQPDGTKVHELGVCPASIATDLDGVNGGKNGGRSCWAIAKTLCENRVQGTFSQKLGGCMDCDFYTAVREEERENYIGTQIILAKISTDSEYKTGGRVQVANTRSCNLS